MKPILCKNSSLESVLEEIMHQNVIESVVFSTVESILRNRNRKRFRSEFVRPYAMVPKIPDQVKHLSRLVGVTDVDCINNLRMDRNTFGRLCLLLRQISDLSHGKYVKIEEQVAMFLGVLAHHNKNRIVSFTFLRSGHTVSRYLHAVLNAIIKLHAILFVKPEPVPDDCTDSRWKWFRGCLGALDGSYINVMVPNEDKPRYRTQKGQIATNTLAVCDRKLMFAYILPGWEGSAADSRVLR
ncbi:uncharacterized protein LOC121773378 [Salvia splendens]|uniref:uncharacterized protein LOC121773378 n=1 Tax=Salvia splendens TaxID=180675 RepID=UPI001C26BDE7|nr:uncharacterized protein LOC121773378 [Salvia splendens]XP_042026163.1 uncharacterized protein LOC121773378 [Salvia splendens]